MIDHLIYGTRDLGPAAEALERQLGVRAAGGGQHRGIGTRNELLGLGRGSYLEIIGPDPEQPDPSMPRPFGVDDLEGPRLSGWALRCDDIDAAIARARDAGYDPGPAFEMQRVTPEGKEVRWRLTLNALAGGPIPFLIAWGDSEHPSISAPTGLTLVSFHIEHPDPSSIAPMLHALSAEVDVIDAADQSLVATIEGPAGSIQLR